MKRYTIFLIFETFVNLLKMTCFFVGSYDPNYYSATFPDGYSFIRLSLVGLDLSSFTFLALVILLEPFFLANLRKTFKLQESTEGTEDEGQGLLEPEDLITQGLKDARHL